MHSWASAPSECLTQKVCSEPGSEILRSLYNAADAAAQAMLQMLLVWVSQFENSEVDDR